MLGSIDSYLGLGGFLFAAIGMVLIVWGWRWDPSRGRRRCPRCWYDLSATHGATCSECGYQAQRESVLFRTRRSRTGMSIGSVLLVLAYLTVRWPSIQRDGWRVLIPTSSIVLMGRWYAGTSTLWGDEIERRAEYGEIADWQLSWLLWWAWTDENPPVEVELILRDEWPIDMPLRGRLDVKKHWLKAFQWNAEIQPHMDSIVHPQWMIGWGPTSTVSYDATHWDDETVEITPELIEGSNNVSHSIQTARADYTTDSWLPVHMRSQVQSVVGVILIDQVMSKVQRVELDDALKASLTVTVNQLLKHGIDPQFGPPLSGKPESMFADITFAVQLEILHGENVVTSTRYWWKRGLQESSPYRGWLPFDICDQQELAHAQSTSEDPTWRVRIRCFPEFALRDFESDQYWDGEIEVPLIMWDPMVGN